MAVPRRSLGVPIVKLGSFRAWLARHHISALGGGAALGVIRAAFSVGEWVAPHLAGRLGQAIWFRVPPAPPAAQRNRGLAPGTPLDIVLDGRRLQAFSWGEGPVVLLMHGWSGWWQQLSVYVEPLVAAGFRVVAWDAPSHGESAPGRYGRHYSSIADVMDATAVVADYLGAVEAIVAHSAGSMAAGVAIATGLVSPKRVVFVSPSVTGDDHIAYLTQHLGWGPRTARLVQHYADRRHGVRMADYNVPQLIADSTCDLPEALFVYDADDYEVPTDSAARLAEHWPGAQVVVTHGFDHFRVLWAPQTIQHAVDFLAGKAVSPTPAVRSR
ncbi:MAG TPA: alpha/beta hydrolase [Propionicimonas sp.]|nr:alpha/beta hydrolase [Propionicimonas sp.]